MASQARPGVRPLSYVSLRHAPIPTSPFAPSPHISPGHPPRLLSRLLACPSLHPPPSRSGLIYFSRTLSHLGLKAHRIFRCPLHAQHPAQRRPSRVRVGGREGERAREGGPEREREREGGRERDRSVWEREREGESGRGEGCGRRRGDEVGYAPKRRIRTSRACAEEHAATAVEKPPPPPPPPRPYLPRQMLCGSVHDEAAARVARACDRGLRAWGR